MKNQVALGILFFQFALLISVSNINFVSAADFRPLIGKWQRSDGGYVIEISRVAGDGTMEAAYYNPNPIHVSLAKASFYKGYLKVEVELQDTGYPGSTYTLIYDPEKDALLGLYFQAMQKQNFEVIFVRMNR